MTFATPTTATTKATNSHIYFVRWLVLLVDLSSIQPLYLSFVILNLPKFVCRKIPVNAFAPVTFTNSLQQNNKIFNLLYPNDLWQSLFRLFISTLIEIILFVSFIPSHLLLLHRQCSVCAPPPPCFSLLVSANSTEISSNFSSNGGEWHRLYSVSIYLCVLLFVYVIYSVTI